MAVSCYNPSEEKTMLRIERVSEKTEILKEIHRLYDASFPDDERIPWKRIFAMLGETRRMYAYYDGEVFVGLSYTFIHRNIAYLGYLAVEEGLRNRGYGSAILKCILKELSEKGLDTSHIEKLSKQIADLKKKKEILENKDNILFYGKYKEFVNEYSKKDYYDNQLKLAREKMEEFEKEHKQDCEKLEKDSLSLFSIINSEKGQMTSISKEIEMTTDFLKKEDACPSYLMSSDYEINEDEAQVIIGSITLDCRDGKPDPMSEAFLQMAGVFSQLELAMIRARVRSGMENARAKGKRIGRPQMTADSIPAAFLRHYPAYKVGRLNVSELARVCDLSRTTAYKYIGLLEG